MPIDVFFAPDRRGLVYRSGRTLELDDFQEAHARLVSDRERLAALRYMLVDLTALEHIRMSPAHVRAVGSITRSNLGVVDEGAIAVVAPRPVVFGMARMWELLAWTPYSTRIFRERSAAREWLEREMARRRLDVDVAGFLSDVDAAPA